MFLFPFNLDISQLLSLLMNTSLLSSPFVLANGLNSDGTSFKDDPSSADNDFKFHSCCREVTSSTCNIATSHHEAQYLDLLS